MDLLGCVRGFKQCDTHGWWISSGVCKDLSSVILTAGGSPRGVRGFKQCDTHGWLISLGVYEDLSSVILMAGGSPRVCTRI